MAENASEVQLFVADLTRAETLERRLQQG